MLPAVGFGLLVLSAILIGGVYPAIIQQFVVKPNELAKETPYIQREISTTRQAYGMACGTVPVSPVLGVRIGAAQPCSARQVSTLQGMRLLDPDVVSPTFQQLQQVKSYYQFPATLVDGPVRLPGAGRSRRTWWWRCATWAARRPARATGSTPTWCTRTASASSPPPRTRCRPTATPRSWRATSRRRGRSACSQPRVYFGEQENAYAIVGGPPGGRKQELDYPSGSAGGQQNNTYHGGGGVPVGSLLDRLLYAVKFRELNILLSGAINSHSKILYDRQPLARVAKVAPFLTLDGNPYPVVANGQIFWVVDGYTTTDLYPYSERLSMAQATVDQ